MTAKLAWTGNLALVDCVVHDHIRPGLRRRGTDAAGDAAVEVQSRVPHGDEPRLLRRNHLDLQKGPPHRRIPKSRFGRALCDFLWSQSLGGHKLLVCARQFPGTQPKAWVCCRTVRLHK